MVRYDVFFIKFSSSKHYLVVLCSTVNHCDHWLSDTERSIISRLKFWDWLFDTCSAILSRRLMANSTLEIVSYTQSLHYRWLVACCLRKVLPYKPTSCSLVGNRSWTISAENNRLDMLGSVCTWKSNLMATSSDELVGNAAMKFRCSDPESTPWSVQREGLHFITIECKQSASSKVFPIRFFNFQLKLSISLAFFSCGMLCRVSMNRKAILATEVFCSRISRRQLV